MSPLDTGQTLNSVLGKQVPIPSTGGKGQSAGQAFCCAVYNAPQYMCTRSDDNCGLEKCTQLEIVHFVGIQFIAVQVQYGANVCMLCVCVCVCGGGSLKGTDLDCAGDNLCTC